MWDIMHLHECVMDMGEWHVRWLRVNDISDASQAGQPLHAHLWIESELDHALPAFGYTVDFFCEDGSIDLAAHSIQGFILSSSLRCTQQYSDTCSPLGAVIPSYISQNCQQLSPAPQVLDTL